jgi:hypothetical protein
MQDAPVQMSCAVLCRAVPCRAVISRNAKAEKKKKKKGNNSKRKRKRLK